MLENLPPSVQMFKIKVLKRLRIHLSKSPSVQIRSIQVSIV